ncbi:MAG: tetratricopeptide repeat protein [Deltaproteobacteria bacterium]|nr:tetratricopeptide repeat protein [Deltaproteobacteria bacterium]
MAKSIIIYTLLSLLMIWTLFSQMGYGKSLGEDEKLILVGVGAFNDGFYDISEKQFSQFLRDYPDHAKLHDVCYLLGKTLYYRDKLKESRSLFLKVINENKQFDYIEYILFWLADIEIRWGNNEGARRYFISLLNRYPKFEHLDRANYLLGLIEFGSNRLSQAESYFKKTTSLSRDPELIQSSNFWLGILSFKQNRFEEATGYFKPAISDLKHGSSFFVKYASLWAGEAHLRSGKLEEAKNIYRSFYERFKGEDFIQEVHWKLGYCDYRMGNLNEAISTLQSFKTQFKDSPLILYTHYLLGEIFLQQSDHSSSIKELNTIFTKSKENPLWGIAFLSLFWNHVQQNDLLGANKVFQRLQKLNHFDDEKAILQWLNAEMTFGEGKISDSLPYYFNILNTKYRENALWRIGKGYFFESKFREAITNFDILLLESPNSRHTEEALFLKGESLIQSGHWPQALETYGLLAQKDVNRHWKLFALIQTGNIHFSLKESGAAEKAFKRVIQDFQEHPLSSYAAFQLGKLFFKENNILEAIHYYSMILKGGRLELLGGTYFSLGEIFYQQEKYDKASRSFEMALRYLQESSPWFFLTHLEIGNLQRKQGKYEEAKRSYLTILNQAKDEDIKRAATELLRQIGSEK